MTGMELAMGAMAAGAMVSAAGSIAQGQAASEMADYNAQVAENEAASARIQAGYEEGRQREHADRVRSAARAAIAKSGVDLEGSPRLGMVDNAVYAEIDALAIRNSGTVAEARARSQAGLDRMQGRAAVTGSYYGAGASLLGGASSLARLYSTGATKSAGISDDYPRDKRGDLVYDP